MHRTTSRFWRHFEQLPGPVQRTARRNFRFLIAGSPTSCAPFQKGRQVLSVRVGLDYRALAVEDEGDYIWVWIGKHDEYDRLIGA